MTILVVGHSKSRKILEGLFSPYAQFDAASTVSQAYNAITSGRYNGVYVENLRVTPGDFTLPQRFGAIPEAYKTGLFLADFAMREKVTSPPSVLQPNNPVLTSSLPILAQANHPDEIKALKELGIPYIDAALLHSSGKATAKEWVRVFGIHYAKRILGIGSRLNQVDLEKDLFRDIYQIDMAINAPEAARRLDSSDYDGVYVADLWSPKLQLPIPELFATRREQFRTGLFLANYAKETKRLPTLVRALTTEEESAVRQLQVPVFRQLGQRNQDDTTQKRIADVTRQAWTSVFGLA